jgi:hypothetical protein
MTYQRKTTDLFVIEGLYFGQWEEETAETTRAEGRQRLQEYRENMPEYCHRLIKRREKREINA